MKAVIVHQEKDVILIEWQKKGVGFGQLRMEWKKNRYEIDAECMGIDFVIEIFQALEK